MSSTVSRGALEAAMKEAVASKLIPAHCGMDTYLDKWKGMESVLAAAYAVQPVAQLAPHEARKLYDLLGAEFGLGAVQPAEIVAQPELTGLTRYTYGDLANAMVGEFRAPPTEYIKATDAEALLARLHAKYEALRQDRNGWRNLVAIHVDINGGPPVSEEVQKSVKELAKLHSKNDVTRSQKSQPALKLAEDGKGE